MLALAVIVWTRHMLAQVFHHSKQSHFLLTCEISNDTLSTMRKNQFATEQVLPKVNGEELHHQPHSRE